MPLLMIYSSTIQVVIGGTTTVLNNDTLNGVILNPADVNLTLSGTAPTGFVLNSNGTITVPLDRFQVPIWFYKYVKR
jgi:hypothetical protein